MTFTRTDDATLRQMLTELRDVPWHWRVDEVDDLAARLGWRITDRWDKGAEFEVAWALPDRGALLTYWTGGARQMDFDLTAHTGRGPETAAAADDAFAEFAAIGTEVLGMPDESAPGRNPSLLWRTAESTFELSMFADTITVTWSSNDYRQFLKETAVEDTSGLEDEEDEDA